MPETGDPLPPLRDIIRDYDLRASKVLGQNFILDLNLTRRIARTAGQSGSSPLNKILEIGPGPGGLGHATTNHNTDGSGYSIQRL